MSKTPVDLYNELYKERAARPCFYCAAPAVVHGNLLGVVTRANGTGLCQKHFDDYMDDMKIAKVKGADPEVVFVEEVKLREGPYNCSVCGELALRVFVRGGQLCEKCRVATVEQSFFMPYLEIGRRLDAYKDMAAWFPNTGTWKP